MMPTSARVADIGTLLSRIASALEPLQSQNPFLYRPNSRREPIDYGLRELVDWGLLDFGYEDMHERIADLETRLQYDPRRTPVQVRNRHVLLLTLTSLRPEDVTAAMSVDPGLVMCNPREIRGETTIAFVRWDAGCAFCGKSFELDASGRPLGNSAGNQLSLFKPEDVWGRESPREPNPLLDPQGYATCPHCGWKSQLSKSADELVVHVDWPTIAIYPSPVAFEWRTRARGESYSISPGRLELDANWEFSEVAFHSPIRYAGSLRLEQQDYLDDFPVVRAIAERLSPLGIDLDALTDASVRTTSDLVVWLGDHFNPPDYFNYYSASLH